MNEIWQKIIDGELTLKEVHELRGDCVPLSGMQLTVHSAPDGKFEIRFCRLTNKMEKSEKFIDCFTDLHTAQFFSSLGSVMDFAAIIHGNDCNTMIDTGMDGVGWTVVIG